MSTNISRRALVGGLLTAGLARGVAQAAPAPADSPRKELEAQWSALAQEELVASRALLKLAARPKEAVAFIAEVLKPLRIDKARVRSLLTDMGSEKEQTWKAAVEELEYFDPRLVIDLPTLMDDVTDPLARPRLVALLSGDRTAESLVEQNAPLTLNEHRQASGEVYYNFRCKGSWWAEHRVERINVGPWGNRRKYWTRAVRAIVLLEHVGTPTSLAALKSLATGHPDAQPTKAAKEAVARLQKGE
jgi:hypothetical protein